MNIYALVLWDNFLGIPSILSKSDTITALELHSQLIRVSGYDYLTIEHYNAHTCTIHNDDVKFPGELPIALKTSNHSMTTNPIAMGYFFRMP